MVTKRLSWSLLMLALVFLLVAVAPAANGQKCGSGTLKGIFGFIAQGTVPGSPAQLAVVSGIVNYDGAGNHSGESIGNYGLGATPPDTVTGTQTVNPDCTFSGQHKGVNGAPDTNFVGTITGSDMSQEIHFIVTDPGMVAYGTDYRIPSGGCSLSTLNGRYAFFGQGTRIIDNAPLARVGMVTYDGAGNLAGHGTVAVNGAAGAPYTFTGKYTVDAKCTVSVELGAKFPWTKAAPPWLFGAPKMGIIHEVGRITREDFEVDLIVTDPGFVFAETMRKQGLKP